MIACFDDTRLWDLKPGLSIPVLELEEAGEATLGKLRGEISAALEKDGAGAIALGCAGMAGLADMLSREFRVPVVDGVSAAVRLAEVMLPAEAG